MLQDESFRAEILYEIRLADLKEQGLIHDYEIRLADLKEQGLIHDFSEHCRYETQLPEDQLKDFSLSA